MDAYTARIAASEQHVWLRTKHRPSGHADYRPPAEIIPLQRVQAAEETIALVMLAPRVTSDLLVRVRDLRFCFDQIVIVLEDTTAGPVRLADDEAMTVLERRIDGDFAGQRNAAQAVVKTGWAFHLDIDEWPDHSLLATMRPLAKLARQDGIDAVGFPRRNLVDGQMASLFPDTQYRLIRNHVRFVGAVHERPDACSEWPRTTIALTGALDHFLSGERIEARHRAYAQLGQSADRNADLLALRSPFWSTA
ncbi:hypothetical protein [Notoacmeibacter marinus]|uniref:hypothetical protein n=1 Tax=Notoacmeibacter marinus TaxID=1876515 RepID=UPI0013B0547F|nr:hypothetical protein [Notoacmeibacter marinus]